MTRSKDRLIQVEIYGQRYSLRAADEADARHVEACARHVDTKMREIAQTTPTVDSFKVAVMAAVNIADEYLRAAHRAEAVEDYAREKADQIGALLDQSLKAR